MLELLWMLLPVAALSGWYAGRRGQQAPAPARSGDHGGYFKGINYLLNEQPDKAIEVFTQMVEVDSDTVETHLALGNLFRRRGEVDRAIRIHQNLVARPSLTAEQRAYALLELGEDYMRAGLLDRAESLFKQVVSSGVHVQAALRQLLVIYQQTQEWEKAIDVAKRLRREYGGDSGRLIAQMMCEQAEQARVAGDLAGARQKLKRALSYDANCVRASLILGAIAQKERRWNAALKAYRRVVEQDIEFLPEILVPMRHCHAELRTEDEYCRFLESVVPRFPGPAPVLMLSELIRQREGTAAAADFLARRLRELPSIGGLSGLIELSLDSSPEEVRRNLEVVHDVVQRLAKGQAGYGCSRCGFAGKTLYWQCPGCRTWSTVKPLTGVKGT